MSKSREQEQWELIHQLTNGTTGACSKKCNDPICGIGCLNQTANKFRFYIMHGVSYTRKRDKKSFPINTHGVINGEPVYVPPPGTECKKGICKDTVCNVVGCMKKPAYYFRDIIITSLEHRSEHIEYE